MKSEIVKSQAKAQLNAIVAMGHAIKEAGSIPSGHVYAACMGIMDLETYERCIDYLVNAGLVKRDVGHVLRWIG